MNAANSPSRLGLKDISAAPTFIGPRKCTREEWEGILFHFFDNVIGDHSWAEDIVHSAREVEGGWCYTEVMAPHLTAILGPYWWGMVDLR